MSSLNIDEAYDYYDKHIHRQRRFDLLKEHNLSVTGSIPNVDWELFGAILTGDRGKEGYGADLDRHEIKSAVSGNSFEYQYHLHGGQSKLNEDKEVNHIFISYSRDYKDVDVRLVSGSELAPIFDGWLPGLIQNYEGADRKQRYRRSITYHVVKAKGQIIMKIRNGLLIYEDESNIPP